MTILRIWIILLSIKLLIGLIVPLSFDEAYYWVWSNDLQLSYFDHPFMVALWFKLGHVFDGFYSAVRWPAIFLAHLSFLIWDQFLKDWLSFDQRKAFMWLCGFSPLLGFGGIIVTPDLPLLLFWSLSVLFFKRVLESNSLVDYLLLGISLGLGFSSKYNLVIIVPAFAVVLFLKRKEINLKYSGLALTVFSGLIFASPPVVWNILNDFESFRFQTAHGLKGKADNSFWPGIYLTSQIALIFPVVLYYALKARGSLILKTMAWAPLLFFFITSFKGKVEGNWPLVAYPAIMALAVLGSKNLRWTKPVMGFWIVGFLLVVNQYFNPILPIPDLDKKLNEIRKTDYLKDKLLGLEPLYASSYQIASKIRREWPKEIFKVTGVSRHDHYDSYPQSIPQKGVFYVIGARSDTKFAMRRNYKYIKKFPIDDRFAYFILEKE